MARAPAQLDATVALQGLRAAVSGEVLMAADPGYDQARTVWNLRHGTKSLRDSPLKRGLPENGVTKDESVDSGRGGLS